ncbi:MAG: acetyl-CoA carboxylase carboxyltransferase subunit alpha [Candidatus Omnitrophota bacterium]
MKLHGLDFEKPILELERKIEELKKFSSGQKINLNGEVKKLEDKLAALKNDIYKNLSPWQRVQIARHPKRPYTLDYINLMMTDFLELHGDRAFADDKAIVTGFAKLDKYKVMVCGHQKGRDTKENLMRNFGCAHPEGYRKALKNMQLAEKFNLPIIIFIDTPGAYPGIGAEERGQAHIIAYNLREMIKIRVPIIVTVIGEGGSGGALGIGEGDRILILENAYYSVISPEGCAAILWKSSTRAPDASEVLKLTGEDLLKFSIVDEIVPEPQGGAHRDPESASSNLKKSILKNLEELLKIPKDELLEQRYQKFRNIGVFGTNGK